MFGHQLGSRLPLGLSELPPDLLGEGTRRNYVVNGLGLLVAHIAISNLNSILYMYI
jgi:hypothetical protein